ncbi:hypothetical protein [Halonatronum saccharophilum]|uniref:hypothetical protein n=1 Tax=Halonatronum saccharophilum TaxID=150060 RepID=UPI000482C0AA|nr:hypothetical protein [Halonatronum saccharophilum]
MRAFEPNINNLYGESQTELFDRFLKWKEEQEGKEKSYREKFSLTRQEDELLKRIFDLFRDEDMTFKETHKLALKLPDLLHYFHANKKL